jgi:hypothetical protein
MSHIEIDDMGSKEGTNASFGSLIGHELNDLNSGMLAQLNEHPIRIDISGDKTWITYTLVQAVDSSKAREFLKALR